MVASVPIARNVATAELSGPPPLPEKLAQNGNVVVGGGQLPLGHAGAACGAMPILEAGTTSLVNAVGRPEISLTGITPDGTTPKYAGSLPSVTSSGNCTSKIKCERSEFGDEPKDTLNCMPSAPALIVLIVPGTEKSPMTLAVRPPLEAALIWSVATLAGHPCAPQINRSLPSLFSTCSGSETLATTCPFVKFELVMLG